jgi:hypothetical protein
VPQGLKALTLAKQSPTPGDRVHSIGNPGASGALWVYTEGKVRQVYRQKAELRDENGKVVQRVDSQVIETQSPTNAGDSGGPLVNDRGELIGVTSSGNENAQLVSQFIDLSEIKALLTRANIRLTVDATASAKSTGTDTADQTGSTSKALTNLTPAQAEAEAKKLGAELLKANGARQEEILQILQETKGVEFSEALAGSIPQLSGKVRDRAREALAERFTRMSAKTLRSYLQEESKEFRRAAVTACERKEAKELVPDIILLLNDSDTTIAGIAYEALKSLTSKDHGRSVTAWKTWWDQQK